MGLLAVLVTSWGVPTVAGAQRVVSSLDVQETQLRYADSLNAAATGVTPSLRLGWDNAAVVASGTFAQLARSWSTNGSVGASVFTPSAGGFSAELAGTLGGSAHQDGARTSVVIGMGRLHLDATSAGAWAGAGGGSTSDGLRSRSVREGEIGLWYDKGPLNATLTAQPTVVDDTIRYTDMTAEGQWRVGMLDLGAVAVKRAGSRLPSFTQNPSVWGSVSAAAWLLPRVALLASAGTYPVDYTQGFPGGVFVSAGVRISLTRAARTIPSRLTLEPVASAASVAELELQGSAGGRRILRLRVPGARTVEVTGDFTGWAPHTLSRQAGGWYSLDTPLSPGTYQMNVRINGGKWLPPPSLTTVSDEFGGLTAVLIVP
jgi:hypothetical protein